MRLSSQAEDYLAASYKVEVEGVEGAQHAPDDRVTGELTRRGLLSSEDQRLLLTKSGRKAAEQAIRRRRLAERLFHDVIDMPDAHGNAAACAFEHSIHHGSEAHICTLLGHPATCPHGRPIPRGRCCRDKKGETAAVIASLSTLKSGEQGVIAYLSSTRSETVRKLMALGVLPGAPVSVMQTFPSIVFQVGQTQLAVDKELAADIFVRRMRDDGG